MKKIIVSPKIKTILGLIRNICAIVWMALTFMACPGPEPEPAPEPLPQPTESITISSSENLSPSFDSDGGSYTISFKSTEAWTAS